MSAKQQPAKPETAATVPALALDDDDDFEEFDSGAFAALGSAAAQAAAEADEAAQQWVDDWDDDALDDQFSQQLRAELTKVQQQQKAGVMQ